MAHNYANFISSILFLLCNNQQKYVPAHRSKTNDPKLHMYNNNNNNNNIAFFPQASWGRLEMKPERNKFKVQAH